jgi:F-type H+-transporting ATPase subunit b
MSPRNRLTALIAHPSAVTPVDGGHRASRKSWRGELYSLAGAVRGWWSDDPEPCRVRGEVRRRTMIDLDVTILIQIANFLVLIVVLNRVLYQPLLRVLEERRRRTEGILAQVETVEEQAAGMVASYEAEIAVAHSEARSLVQERAGQAEAEGQRIVAEAKARSEAELADAEKALEQRRAELAAELVEEVDGLARTIAGKVLGRPV